MKRLLSVFLIFAMMLAVLSGCGNEKNDTNFGTSSNSNTNTDVSNNNGGSAADRTAADLGDDGTTFGESLDELNAYAGYFEEDIADVTVTCVSGTDGCYTLNGNTLTFTSLSEDSVYSVSGQLKGNIVIDVGDDYKLDLELQGFSLVSDTTNPILVRSGDEVSITAKSEFQNYIYDIREAIDDTDETLFSGAIHSMVDLEICGKGSLTLVSENNNGIHSKDDLQVKNLTLLVACIDNALKGNDSVEITEGNTTLIATQGDGIKTTNSDISEKGNQRGTVTINGGSHTVYAACDGIDALIYIYRPSRLSADLTDATAVQILNQCGYNTESCEKCVVKLVQKLREQKDFPHEIGLFLGYPPEDVCGFIEYGPDCCKATGCWKVYNDVENAQKKFALYKKCTRVYCDQLAKGKDIERLTVAG